MKWHARTCLDAGKVLQLLAKRGATLLEELDAHQRSRAQVECIIDGHPTLLEAKQARILPKKVA